MKDYSGEAFLNKLYKDLHMSDVVMHTANSSDNPSEKISKYDGKFSSFMIYF